MTSLPTKYPWVAARVKWMDRALAWPFQHGRTPVTVMLLTLLGILLASLAARGGIRVLGRARDGLVDLLARPSFKHTPDWWQELLLSLAEQLPSGAVSTPDARRQTLFPKLPFWQQSLSTWLIVALILGTTPTDVQAQTYTPVFYYYLDDHLGSSSVLTDRSGVVVQRYTYSAYGRTQHQNNTSAYPLERMFTGQQLDDETGLYFYNARYYDPELGRFIQADTIVDNDSDGQALNRYSYVGNSPVTFTDPSGNIAWFALAVVAGLKTAAIGAAVGAVVGGIASAASGGNIGLGILGGAAAGFLGGFGIGFAGIAGVGMGMTGSTLHAFIALGGGLGGAAGGAASAAISGGDIGLGAAIGGALGAVFGYLDPPSGDAGKLIDADGKESFFASVNPMPQRTVPWWRLRPEQASAATGAAGGLTSALNTALDYASYIPGPIGSLASAGSAVLALSKGEFATAALAAAGIIPGVKYGLKSIQMSRSLAKFPTQIRPNGAIHTLVNPKRLVVSESHLNDISKVFGSYNGRVNALSVDYWKHVLPHRHVYDLPAPPSTLNANWRKTFQKAGASKTTIWPWQDLP